MLNSICVIGLGSLGGYVCKYLVNSIQNIILIDNDIVIPKNITSSIYSSKDIGQTKVDALEKILLRENHNIRIIKIDTKYIEKQTIIPKCDLVIDCRDYICNRTSDIDVKIYISGRAVIIDCRKEVLVNKPYQGAYNIILSKNDIEKAGFLVSNFIFHKKFMSILKEHSLEQIKLDLLDEVIESSITGGPEEEIIYDIHPKLQRKISRLDQSIIPSLELNRGQDVKIILGEINETIFPNYFHEPSDVIKFMGRFVERYGKGKNYILFIDKNNKKIEFVEETGAA